jgi:hypothetical protein
MIILDRHTGCLRRIGATEESARLCATASRLASTPQLPYSDEPRSSFAGGKTNESTRDQHDDSRSQHNGHGSESEFRTTVKAQEQRHVFDEPENRRRNDDQSSIASFEYVLHLAHICSTAQLLMPVEGAVLMDGEHLPGICREAMLICIELPVLRCLQPVVWTL